MHLTRKAVSRKIPIKRKGTKYIVASMNDKNNSVPVLIFVRDMLKLARTNREVKAMIHKKMLKINGRIVRDFRESIKIFNIFEADKNYKLTILPTGKFSFEETKEKDERICKVVGKKVQKEGKIQFNLNDGTNIITKEKINIGDSLILDNQNKIKKHIAIDKAKEGFVIFGKYIGRGGHIEKTEEKKIFLKFNDGGELATLNKEQVIAL